MQNAIISLKRELRESVSASSQTTSKSQYIQPKRTVIALLHIGGENVKKKQWSAHVFYVCDLLGEQCGDSMPYGKHGPPNCLECTDFIDQERKEEQKDTEAMIL